MIHLLLLLKIIISLITGVGLIFLLSRNHVKIIIKLISRFADCLLFSYTYYAPKNSMEIICSSDVTMLLQIIADHMRDNSGFKSCDWTDKFKIQSGKS